MKQEPSLCYRLLRYLNSPAFGFRAEIRSVRHALTILGEREIRKMGFRRRHSGVRQRETRRTGPNRPATRPFL